MAGHPERAHRGLAIAVIAILFVSLLSPVSALADTDLQIGGTARIAYANGDDVRLRESPGYDGTVIRYVREGAVVDVLDGPFEDGDGNLWYQVSYDGDGGFIVSDYLALDSGATAADLPFNPAGDAIGAALIAGTNGDGVRCRVDADRGAAVIAVVPEGETVEIIGAAVGEWQPINCAGQAGYVHTAYVSYDLSGDVAGDEAASDASVEAFAIAGEAVIANTNGDGVNCRASASSSAGIITIVPEDASITLRDIKRGSWQGVICAGQNGYVYDAYLGSGSGDGGGGGSDEVVGEAVVSGTNGDGVRCRAGAGTDSSIIAVLGEGTAVSVRAGGGGDWTPVVCAGQNGYIFSQYLGDGSDGGDGGGSGEVVGEAVVDGSGGGLNCRANPSMSGSIITLFDEGATVPLRDAVDGDWQGVVCAGRNGWAFASYLSTGGGDDDGGGDGGPSNSGLTSGQTAMVSGTNGDGVRFRSEPSTGSSVIAVLGEGRTVDVIDGSTGDWVAVSSGGTSGFVHMDYLVEATDGGGDDGDDGGSLLSGDHAMTLANLNLRYDPSTGSGVAAVAPEGTVVEVIGNPSNDFYPVDWDGLQGYMHGSYLTWTDEALSERGGSGDNDGGGDTDGGGGGGGNGDIVGFAMQYLGYPYVWATHGPSSFDCSGFTYWVILNTLGIDIGAGTFTQINYGSPVSQGNLQPGDLVFFQNTYTWGLSHVGIYVGNGQLIHAENESTGVVISNLSSSYYSSRWYGARRIG